MGVHADAQGVWLDGYVEDFATRRVEPVAADLVTARADLVAAQGTISRQGESITDLLNEVERLNARIVELERPAPQRMLIGTATAPSGGSTDQRVAFVRQMAADLDAAGGALSFVHTFSGATIATFGAAGDNAVLKSFPGMGVMINAKTPGGDWAGVPSGKYRTQFRTLLDSTLARVKQYGGRVLITVDHEPENDGKNAAEWRAAQAWYATEFYAHEIAQHGDYVFVLMGYTMEPSSGRNIADWDVYPQMPADIRDRPLMGWDVYFKAQDSVDTNWNNRAKRAFDWSAQQGHRVVVFEWAVNNDARVPEAQRGAVIAGILDRFKTAGVEAAAYYPHPGPAAGTNPGPGPDGIKALAAASR